VEARLAALEQVRAAESLVELVAVVVVVVPVVAQWRRRFA
jgi:hypothetical protein